MKKIKPYFFNGLFIVFIISVFSGCASLKEGLASQMEVPTLEKQLNRVAVGMTMLRQNNVMIYDMPISADAKWPEKINTPLDDKKKQEIADILQEDPYFATAHYTEFVQRKMLGSSSVMNEFGDYGHFAAMFMNQTISPLTYKMVQRTEAIYGKDVQNWPNIFSYNGLLNNFLEFENGKLTDVEAISGDLYKNLNEAIISFVPINMQKDLKQAQIDMLDAYDKVAKLKAQKELKTQKNQNQLILNEQIKSAEAIANEQEMIYYTLLDDAIKSIQNNIKMEDKNYVNLAKNIKIVLKEVESGAIEAYSLFSLALANIVSNKVIQKFPSELKSLAIAKMYIPSNLQKKYDKRVLRIAKNAIYLLPNIFMGSYYASKQIVLTQKYKDVIEVVIVANINNTK